MHNDIIRIENNFFVNPPVLYMIILYFVPYCLTHSRPTLLFYRNSQRLTDEIPIIDEKAKGPWIILVKDFIMMI